MNGTTEFGAVETEFKWNLELTSISILIVRIIIITIIMYKFLSISSFQAKLCFLFLGSQSDVTERWRKEFLNLPKKEREVGDEKAK